MGIGSSPRGGQKIDLTNKNSIIIFHLIKGMPMITNIQKEALYIHPEILTPEHVWAQLVEVNQQGKLIWKSTGDKGQHMYEDPLRRILCQTSELLELKSIDLSEFEIPKDWQKTDKEYIAPNGDLTNYAGLLRLANQFENLPDQIFNNVLLVGSVNYWGLFYVLTWLKMRGLPNANITLVDSSRHVLDLIKVMKNAGYWSWAGQVKLVHSDIKNFCSQNDKYDIALMDIVLPYAVPLVVRSGQKKGALVPYKAILLHINKLLGENGALLSRTISKTNDIENFPPRPTIDTSKIANAKGHLVKMLGQNLTNRIPEDEIKSTLEFPWEPTIKFYDCGMGVDLPGWEVEKSNTSCQTMGPDSVEILQRLYDDIFNAGNNEVIRVEDQKRSWILQSFCSLKK